MTNLRVAALATLAVVLSGCNSSDTETPIDNDNSITNPGNPTSPVNESSGVEATPLLSFWDMPADDSGSYTSTRSNFSVQVLYAGPVAGAEVCLDTTGNYECDSEIRITNETGHVGFIQDVQNMERDNLIIARFPASELQHGRDSAGLFTEGDTVRLVARGFYQSVTPFTTLEHMQYDPELPALLQLERYAIGRILITNLFDLPADLPIQNAVHWARDNDFSESEIGQIYDSLLPRVEAALAEVSEPYQALQLAGSVAQPQEYSLAASWYGYANDIEPLNIDQLSYVERALENLDNPVMMDAQATQLDVYNQVSGRHITALGRPTDEPSTYSVIERSAQGYLDQTPMVCWNEASERWVEHSGDLSDYSKPELVTDNHFEITNLASGVPSYMVVSPVAADSASYSTAVHNWDNIFDFSAASVDGALMRVRTQANDELCINDNVDQVTDSERFSALSIEEIAEVIRPNPNPNTPPRVAARTQRIQYSSTWMVEYRVIQGDDTEVLLVFPVNSTPENAFIGAWIWRDDAYQPSLFIGRDRLNALSGELSSFILTDAAAVDIATQIRK